MELAGLKMKRCGVDQLVDHRTLNPNVGGSNPPATSTISRCFGSGPFDPWMDLALRARPSIQGMKISSVKIWIGNNSTGFFEWQ